MFLKLMASLSLSVNLSPEDLGQAHDMFSRIFLNTNLRIFLYQILCNNFFWLSQLLKTEKNLLKKLVDSGMFGKFVKTCRELDNRSRSFNGTWWSANEIQWRDRANNLGSVHFFTEQF